MLSWQARLPLHRSTAGEASTSAAVINPHWVNRSSRCHTAAAYHARYSTGYPRSACSSSRAGKVYTAVQATNSTGAIADVKEAHKIFDAAFITVKSGDGGNGEIVEAGRGKYVKNYKYHAGGNQPKKMWLPASDPADGADGADVYIICDPSLDTLLHLHKRKSWVGPKGAQGNPAAGSAGPKRNDKIRKAETLPLEIPVPPGTVIKRKSTGQVLGEVIQPSDRVLVAKGGKGGLGVRAPSRLQKQRELHKELENARKSGGEVVAIEDVNWKDDAKGLPGKQLGLQLLLRVVADIGIVGFPNAGKSSLLSALTRANPEVAPYPFTTLMPNLGVMTSGGKQGLVLADLPGLIEGAHTGNGLGRMFLRHLRRTNVLLHVVDASADDPATDYLAVREELRMYNPDYVMRPHVVALNKMDLEDAGALRQEVADEVVAAAVQLHQQHTDLPGLTAPAAIIPCSAVTGEGLHELATALQSVLKQIHGSQQQPNYGVDQPAQQQSPKLQQHKQVQQNMPSDVAAAIYHALAASMSGQERPSDSRQHIGADSMGAALNELEEYESMDKASSNSAFEPTGKPAGGSKQEDDPLLRLPADDPDTWLFELTEEELLAMADASETADQPQLQAAV